MKIGSRVKQQTDEKRVAVKWVKKANSWCVTVWEGIKQDQKWFSEEEEARRYAAEA